MGVRAVLWIEKGVGRLDLGMVLVTAEVDFERGRVVDDGGPLLG